MTEAKKPVRRAVSKPRELKATLGTMTEHDLDENNTIGALLDAIKDDIVKEAMK